MTKHRELLILLFFSFSVLAGAKSANKDLNPNFAATYEYGDLGIKYLSDPSSYKGQVIEYKGGESLLIACKGRTLYHINYCLIVNPSKNLMFMGFVDFTDNDNPRLMFGSVINPFEEISEENPARTICVRFDMDIDLHTYLPPTPPKGTYYFAREVLDYRCKDPEIYDYEDRYHVNTAYGLVAQTTSGFYAARLSWGDYLTFNAGGTGKAIQKCSAEGQEGYIASSDKIGPRGGYHGTHTNDGRVEYEVIINRPQLMTWKLTPLESNPKIGKLLTITYGSASTPSIKYTYATQHPVMNEIKQAYSRWTTKAPKRYSGKEEFIYLGSLPNWIVIRSVDSDWFDASSYLFIPRAGYEVKTRNEFDPSQFDDVQVHPQYLINRLIREYIPSNE